ncbi:unnamed protein product [Rotaria sordida]|uniref:Uncharacterized protein n=1 Tax=Rotaria sordida TaxID=392033 RepID=A0A813PVJ8_9BILA|nr:unnamed protein product [Rotaria sordida]CAF0759580.1 unnamed protein product [Rotaria sordida]CAF0797451.1 unnamed protein product [Rotaria sordida]CAF0799794.1 unnamed protein product [Rotaria sordida]CAF0805179.1 unnamed protein product [Rotaria sordida]
MGQISSTAIIILVVIAVVIVIIVLSLLICCLCKKCDQCARWSRGRAIEREETARDREIAESRRHFNEIRQQQDLVHDQLRVKYNLNGGDSKTVIVP